MPYVVSPPTRQPLTAPGRDVASAPGFSAEPVPAYAHRGRLQGLLVAALLPVLTVLAVVAGSVVLAPGAEAMKLHTRHHLVRVAASKQGTPYRYGATGPRSFDCSGFTQWVFARVRRHLPRTAAEQARDARRVPASHRRLGDLVFFHDGARVYHVGVYAGDGRIWHAPHTGSRVSLERIWTRSVLYGRVR